MGLRDWFRKTSPSMQDEDASKRVEVDDAQPEQTFAEMQQRRMLEAEALFEQHEATEEAPDSIEAPYDASQTEVTELFNTEVGEAFTHLDEVDVVDVADLDDPYEAAVVEGDLPSPVTFDESENGASV